MQAVVAIWSDRPRAFQRPPRPHHPPRRGAPLGGARAGLGVRREPAAARGAHRLARGHPGGGGALPDAGRVDRRRRFPAGSRPALRRHLRPVAPARRLPAGRLPGPHHRRDRGPGGQRRARARQPPGARRRDGDLRVDPRVAARHAPHADHALAAARRARRGGGHRRCRPRHHPADRGGAAGPAGAEDGGGGAVRRRRGPRPQQHDDDHPRVQRLPAGGARAGDDRRWPTPTRSGRPPSARCTSPASSWASAGSGSSRAR